MSKFNVGDEVMVHDYNFDSKPCRVSAVGRLYFQVHGYRQKFAIDSGKRQDNCGLAYAYTMSEWATRQRVSDAQKLVRRVYDMMLVGRIDKLRDFGDDNDTPPLDEFTRLMARAVELLEAAK